MARNWHKAIAVLLLAWVFLDVAVPGVCPVDNFANSGSNVISMSAESSNSKDPSKSPLGTDDACFCYCAHLLAGSHFALDVFVHGVPVEAPPVYVALDGPPQSLYHPPRS